MVKPKLLLTLAICSSFLASCTTKPVVNICPQPVPVVAQVVNPVDAHAHERLNAVLWMQTSAEYTALASSAYNQAKSAVDAGIKNKKWTAALEQTENYTKLPPAIILDVDETVLNNLSFQAQLIKERKEFNQETWTQWIHKASAIPVPGASEFLAYAASRGVTIFYVTNREATQEADTRINLEKYKMPLRNDIDVILSKNENEWKASDKSARRSYVSKNFRIIALIGDDLGDFVAGAYDTPEKRVDVATANSKYWGSKWFLIPNPVYGSWDASIFNHNYKTPPAEVLDLKFKKLISN